MDATLPRDFHHADEPDVCEVMGCPTGQMLADRLGIHRARADRLEAECVSLRAELAALRREKAATENWRKEMSTALNSEPSAFHTLPDDFETGDW